MTDRNLLRAQLLIEAADILNEGQARNIRVEQKRIMKNIKKEDIKYFKGELSKKEGQKKYTELKRNIEDIKKKIDTIPDETFGEKFVQWGTRAGIPALIFLVASIGFGVLADKGIDQWTDASVKKEFINNGVLGKVLNPNLRSQVSKNLSKQELKGVLKTIGGGVGLGFGATTTAYSPLIAAELGVTKEEREKAEKDPNYVVEKLNFNKAHAERQIDRFEKLVEKTYKKYYSDDAEITVESILNYDF